MSTGKTVIVWIVIAIAFAAGAIGAVQFIEKPFGLRAAVATLGR